MARIYKTARGQALDIDKVKLANETAISVGNMRVNARGDLLANGAMIATGRNQIMDQVYAVPDAGPLNPLESSDYTPRRPSVQASNAKDLTNLVNNLNVTTETPPETTPTAPTTRGSLASSVAAPTTVKQEPEPNPKDVKKSQGPSRI